MSDQIVTANRLADGRVVFLTEDADWSARIADSRPATGAAAGAAGCGAATVASGSLSPAQPVNARLAAISAKNRLSNDFRLMVYPHSNVLLVFGPKASFSGHSVRRV